MAELRILHVVFHTFCVNCGKSARFVKKGKTVGEKVFPAKLTKEKILTRRSKSIDNGESGCYNLFNFITKSDDEDCLCRAVSESRWQV